MKKSGPKKEILRQVIHLLCGVAGVANIYFDIVQLRYVFIIFVFGIILFVNINFTTEVHPLLKKLISYVEREKGLVGQGVLTLFFSYMVLHSISYLYPAYLEISLTSMAILAYGDSAGTIFGVLTNKFILPYNKKKNFIGVFMGILFATMGSMIFTNPLFAFITASVAMFFESTDLRIRDAKIDDNLLVPFVSFITMFLLTRL